MAWINVSSVRHLLLDDLEYFEPEQADLNELGFDGMRGLMVMQPEIVRQAVAAAQPQLAAAWPDWLARVSKLRRLPEAGDMVATTALCHWLTGDFGDELRAFSEITGVKSAPIAALQQVMRYALGTDSAATAASAATADWRGHIEERDEWWPLVSELSLETLFELALAPDHDSWPTLGYFLVPLALALRREREVDDGIFRYGARPGDRPELIYERIQLLPGWKTSYDPDNRETWRGFDAVARTSDGELKVYHYLTSKWQAPLLCTDETDAFRFLGQLESSWKLVRDTVDDLTWQRIRDDQARGREVHIVVYDASVANALPAHSERAASLYGVNLRTCDVLDPSL